MIPGGGGFVVAERLKQSQATHHIPIIFLTGIPGGEERAHQLGASGYVMKPYHPDEVDGDHSQGIRKREKRRGGFSKRDTGVTF